MSAQPRYEPVFVQWEQRLTSSVKASLCHWCWRNERSYNKQSVRKRYINIGSTADIVPAVQEPGSLKKIQPSSVTAKSCRLSCSAFLMGKKYPAELCLFGWEPKRRRRRFSVGGRGRVAWDKDRKLNQLDKPTKPTTAQWPQKPRVYSTSLSVHWATSVLCVRGFY